MSEFQRRQRDLRVAVVAFVGTEDEFGLTARKPFQPTSNAGKYAFMTTDAKLDAFNDWLQSQIDSKVLGIDGVRKGRANWSGKYVESAYKKGLVRAYTDAHKERLDKESDFYRGGKEQFLHSAFASPEAMSKIKLLATRSFENMKGFTDAERAMLNRVLADSMTKGLGARATAKAMTERIDTLTRTRAMTIARTEIIHAHAEGQLDAFTLLGVEELGVMAEWSTAGDLTVCSQCDDLARRGPYTIKEARGMIPAHPNCRCAWMPTTEEKEKDPEKKVEKTKKDDEGTQKVKEFQPMSASSYVAKTAEAPARLALLRQDLEKAITAGEMEKVREIRTKMTDLGSKEYASAAKIDPRLQLPAELRGSFKFDPNTVPEGQDRYKAIAAKSVMESMVHKSNIPDFEIKTHLTASYSHRASFSQPSNGVAYLNMGTHSETKTWIHELAHSIEYGDPEISKATKAFLMKRSNGALPEKMSHLTGQGGYRYHEEAYRDEFVARGSHAYAGKVYPDQATELVTMGMERLFADPRSFAQQDPEYFDFILNLLQVPVKKPTT